MATLTALPLRNDTAWYSFTFTLSSTVYLFTIRYDQRMDRWIMDLADANSNPLVSGVPLLVGRNLIGRFVTEGLPVGYFFVTDDTNTGIEPTRFSFGTTHTLYFVES